MMKKTIKSCLDIPMIDNCGVSECSYNDMNNCRAVAITVGGHSPPLCDTHFVSGEAGGIKSMTGGIGACRESSCTFNESLECCSDSGVSIALQDGKPQCMTFESM